MKKEGVIRFLGSNHPLSNFHPSKFTINGVEYDTVEHYFQSEKAIDEGEKQRIIKSNSPKIAKRLGGKCKLNPNWESIKNNVMYKALHAKFTQNMKLKSYLLGTNNKYLIEDNRFDNYWGIGRGDGQNTLGKLLMILRNKLRSKNEKTTG